MRFSITKVALKSRPFYAFLLLLLLKKIKKIFILLFCLDKRKYSLVGPEGSRDFGPFHFKPKVHAEEKEVSEDE